MNSFLGVFHLRALRYLAKLKAYTGIQTSPGWTNKSLAVNFNSV